MSNIMLPASSLLLDLPASQAQITHHLLKDTNTCNSDYKHSNVYLIQYNLFIFEQNQSITVNVVTSNGLRTNVFQKDNYGT